MCSKCTGPSLRNQASLESGDLLQATSKGGRLAVTANARDLPVVIHSCIGLIPIGTRLPWQGRSPIVNSYIGVKRCPDASFDIQTWPP